MSILDNLNPRQFDAVTSRSRSILVLAGAGSGKTSVLTKRIAHLISEHKVSPRSILALTFTRKASREMSERISTMIPKQIAEKIRMGTFHAMSLRMLEAFGEHIGYRKNISVYDEVDQRDIVSGILDDLSIKVKATEVVKAMNGYASDCDGYEFEEGIITKIVAEYRRRLRSFNAVDFGMILTETLRLIRECSTVYDYYHRLYEHVLVDEYQDVDRTQYHLHEAIAPDNLFCVGDLDQSIYGWRGSDISIVREFKDAHPGSEIIMLEESFRCPPNVITLSNNLISHNVDRFEKRLFTQRVSDPPCMLMEVEDRDAEATRIVEDIQRLYDGKWSEFAILTRTHSQHEIFIEALQEAGIPVRSIGKDMLAWKSAPMRMILSFFKFGYNHTDSWHFRRVAREIVYPSVSDREWLEIEAEALRERKRFIDVVMEKHGNALEMYVDLFAMPVRPTEAMAWIIEHTPIREYFEIRGLTTKASEIDYAMAFLEQWEGDSDSPFIDSFLEWIAEQDVQSEIRENDDTVKVATIHAVKGLEFRNVLLPDFVEGKIPHGMALREARIEEERRLAYVAITRVIDHLIIYVPASDLLKGGIQKKSEPSRFIAEMREAKKEEIS